MSMIRMKTLEPSIAKRVAELDTKVQAGQLEKIVHTIYHIKEIAGDMGGTKYLPSELNFFSIKTGQNDDNGIPTTYADTNMDSPSAISQGYYFWGQTIRVVALHSKSDETPLIKSIDKTALEKFFINDIGKVFEDGVLTIEVADKPLVRIAPIMSCPSGIGLKVASVQGDGSFANANFENSESILSNSRPFDLWLENNLTFKFRINYPSAKKIYNSFRLGCFIDGILYRPRA